MGDVQLQAMFRGCMITVHINPVKPIYMYIPPIDYLKIAGFTQEERLCMKMYREIRHGQIVLARTDQAPFWVYQYAIACTQKTKLLTGYCMINHSFAKFIKKECAIAILKGKPSTEMLRLAGLFKVTRNTDQWEAYARMICCRTRQNIHKAESRRERSRQIALTKEKQVNAERVQAFKNAEVPEGDKTNGGSS
jgi:hypothetical protein